MTFAEDIEAAASEVGETILWVVIAPVRSLRNLIYIEPEEYPKAPVMELLPWGEARAYLDYRYDTEIGSADCHPVFAWSESWVFCVREYDGSTCIGRAPRNPIVCEPEYM